MKLNSSGQVSRLFLVLAVVIFVAVIITFLVLRMATPPPAPSEPVEPAVEMPKYEAQLGDIRFVFQSAINRGKTLKASEIINKQYSSWSKDYSTVERFIQVTIGAQNKGKENIEERAWDMQNIVDSEGREFTPVTGYNVTPWLPSPDKCGALLKPEFDPVPCVKIYEVSTESTGLKIRVITGKDNKANNLSSKKFDEALIDLIVK